MLIIAFDRSFHEGHRDMKCHYYGIRNMYSQFSNVVNMIQVVNIDGEISEVGVE